LIPSDIEKIYIHIGKQIKAARNAKNIKQEDLAKMVGLSRTSIVNIEKGRQRLLIHTLVDIGNALSVDIGALLAPAAEETFSKALNQLPENQKKAVQILLNKKGDKK
jgi:transcriptional regulator with XRE-family HTH domain